MVGLKEMLLLEQDRLERILQKTTERLQDAPQGTLHLSSSSKWVQYYHRMPGEKGKGKYIPGSDKELIRRLAQKSYDEKVAKLAGRRLSQIRRIAEEYADEEMEEIFLKEHREKQKMIRPVETTWEELLGRWMAEDCKRKEFREDTPVILTEQGERVRSKSEKILADYFFRNRIPYKYEKPLELKGYGTVHPDFTFLSKGTKQEIYWEHNGKMDDPEYARNAVRKICAYENNGILQGERLILTFETEKNVLDTRTVEKLADRYLL